MSWEVQTMTSRTSFCNGTLLRKNITRFWPLWALFTIGLLLFFFSPARQAALSHQERYGALINVTVDEAGDLMDYQLIMGTCATMSYAIVCAVCCFSYLHKTRSAYMLHAFPVSRGVLFRTNVLSGLLFFLVPWTVVTGLEMLVLLPSHSFFLALLRSYALVCMEYLFFFGLAVARMHITGKTVYGVLTYLALNYLAVGYELLFYVVLEPLLFGIELSSGLSTLFSPMVELIRLGGRASFARMTELWLYCGIVAAMGVVFLAVAWLLYRARRMESCGETIAYRFARPIFKYLLALLSALLLGVVALAMFYGEIYVNGSLLMPLIFLLLGGFVGYFGAEMMLRRSLRVFRARAWLGFACFAAVLVSGLLVVRYDGLRVIRCVPDSEDIVSVDVVTQGRAMTLTDEADINELRAIHADWTQSYIDNGLQQDYYDYGNTFYLTYHLTDGDTLERRYTFSYGECYGRLATLLTQPELTRDAYAGVLERASQIVVESDYSSGALDSYEFTDKQRDLLIQCIYADVEAGRLSYVPYLNGGEVRYYLTVYSEPEPGEGVKVMVGSSIVITSDAMRTLAYLKSLER